MSGYQVEKELEYYGKKLSICWAFKHVPLHRFSNCRVCAKPVLSSVRDVELYSWKGTQVILYKPLILYMKKQKYKSFG